MDNYQTTCKGCGAEYYFLPQSDDYRIYIFLDTPEYNSAVVTCPLCRTVDTQFGTSGDVLRLLSMGLRLSISDVAPDDVRAGYAEMVAGEQAVRAERYEEWLIDQSTDEEIWSELNGTDPTPEG